MLRPTPCLVPPKPASVDKKIPFYQLQNVIVALEDAKLFGNNIYALIVDFTSAVNTTDHDKMLMIMYHLGFPTDAIEIVKKLHEEATTRVKHPSGHSTNPIHIERGTIQEDTLSPFSSFCIWSPSCAGCMWEDAATRTPAFKEKEKKNYVGSETTPHIN